MALYVIRPDNPPAGEDWLASVPGQYLYNIAGIYATLNTGGTTGLVCPDASGNGNDGVYNTFFGTTTFVAGLVTGNNALDLSAGSGLTPKTSITPPPNVIGWDAGFTIALLWENNTAAPEQLAAAYTASNLVGPFNGIQFEVQDGATARLVLNDENGHFWESQAGALPFDGAPHLVAVTVDGDTVVFYVDGVAQTTVITDTNPGGSTFTAAGINGNASGALGVGILDEYALLARPCTAGEIAGLQSARGSFAAYNAAMLELGPDLYYHLADGIVSGGRQVTLAITDSNNEVARLPSGFDVLAGAGPFAWSWLPKLNSAAENATAETITVPVPTLLLPAGYTIGTKTLDITPTDQWSDIAIWWNSDAMDASQEINPYAYPPGATLVYRQIQGSP